MESKPTPSPGPEGHSKEPPTLSLPTFDDIRGQDFMNNCAIRSVFSFVGGGGLGLFMGMLLGALDTPVHADQMTVKQHFKHAIRQMGSRSLHSALTFAILGGMFAGTECVIEKARAKHDTTNTVVAGCVTGGVLSARAGPKAACFGCAGFAAFSVVIEKIFEHQN
eukprot:c29318_g1_i1 orf=273-767(+)